MTPLAELLTQRLEDYSVSDASKETFVTVRLHGKGAVRRQISEGRWPLMPSGYRLVPGDLVYSRIDARNGAFAIVPDGLAGAVVSKDFPCFAIKTDRINPSFLIRFLTSVSFYSQLQEASYGTTNRQRISERALLSQMVPLPPLSDQIRYVSILDDAQTILNLRAEAINKTDQIPQALFYQMFSDPLFKTHRWQGTPLGTLGQIVTGNTPPRGEPSYFGNHIEWVKTNDIDTLRGLVSRSAEGLSESGSAVGRVVPKGSVLITCIAGSLDRIGDAAVTDRSVAINQQINAIVPSNDVNSEFLWSLVQALRPLIQAQANGVMTRIVSKSSLEMIEGIKPPFELQEEFGEKVRHVAALREIQAAAAQRLQQLFQSLLRAALQGEL